MHSIVVMESGADWSPRVDHEAGRWSQVVVITKKSGESNDAFEKRVRLRIDAIDAQGITPMRGILVIGRSTKWSTAVRSIAGRALSEAVRRAGGGEVVIMGDEQPKLAGELETYIGRLNKRHVRECAPISLRFRANQTVSSARRVA